MVVVVGEGRGGEDAMPHPFSPGCGMWANQFSPAVTNTAESCSTCEWIITCVVEGINDLRWVLTWCYVQPPSQLHLGRSA